MLDTTELNPDPIPEAQPEAQPVPSIDKRLAMNLLVMLRPQLEQAQAVMEVASVLQRIATSDDG